MTDQPDVYGVIGHPVSHSWSPFIHGLFARQTDQNMVYRKFDVPPEGFRGFLVEFFEGGGKGLNVTVPHKPAAADFCNELTPRATRASAVNTLAITPDHTLLGDNTDGAGLVRDLVDHLQLALGGRHILILGAGGAARGILAPLLELGPAEVVLANRSPARARSVARAFAQFGPVRGCSFEEISGEPVDLVINATAASLQGEVPEVTAEVLDRGTVCYDLAYGHAGTPFVRWAEAGGCARAVQGWGMLVEQAAESFTLWRGVRPDTQPVLAALQSHPLAQARGL